MLMAMRGAMRVDRHAADRIGDPVFRGRRVLVQVCHVP